MNKNEDGEYINSSVQVHFEKDKQLVPYFFTCKNLEYLGSVADGEIVYFKFAPKEKVAEAIERYYSRTAEPAQPKDLLDNVERFKTEIFRHRDGMKGRD